MDSLTESKKAASALDVFAGGGEMGELMRSRDWSQTSLGSALDWGQSLSTSISILLASRFPMCLFWGRDYIQFYNDDFAPILGTAKHPTALGQPGSQTWLEIWDVLEPLFEQVMSTGEAIYAKDQSFHPNRKGYVEESYFTFCYSAVRDETGNISGILNTVTETTKQVISQRRLAMLRELATAGTGAKTPTEACLAAARTLNPYDIPFALFYLIDKQGKQAELVASTGLPAGSAAAPTSIDLTLACGADVWSFSEVLQHQQPQVVTDVVKRFGSFAGEPWSESLHSAMILPILSANKKIVECLLVAGISPRLDLDGEYRTLLELVAQQVENSIANAQAYEKELKRALALAELDRAKTAFFTNVSHEFRTPLTLILNPLEQVIAQTHASLQPEQREQLAIVQRNAMRLHKLVNTLLDFSRIEADRIQAVYEPTDLAQFTAELASVFRSAIETASLQLIVDCPPLSDLVYVDREMWEKIVLNLISNAFKFTFTGEIAVSLHQIGDKVELKIRDTGTGITDEELPKIFERFHRIRGVKARNHEGSGIGLALVAELVHLHGGTVNVESVFGKGTTFTVTLPTGLLHLPSNQISAKPTLASTSVGAALYFEEAQQWLTEENLWVWGRHKVAAPNPPPINSSQFSTARILLVDDNTDMRDYVARLLSKQWQVEAVNNGVAALAAVSLQPPDLVLTDVMMPEMDGFELLSALRADPKTKGIPIIMLSARAGEEAAIEGLQAGANDYIIKPFSAQELVARVDSHLQMARLRQELSSNHLKDEFLATVTHELHAPLVAILGWTRLLRSNQLDRSTALRALDTIERSANNQAMLIEDLLNISTILSGKVHIDRQPVNLTSTVGEVMQTMFSDAQAKRIQIVETRRQSLQKDICVCGDLIRLQQVFSKLLHNAIKFTPKGGSIEVRLDAVDSWCSIQVSDNGIGISADFLPHVFDRFTQEEVPSRHTPGGLGLGLAIARQLVELHGGTIEAASDGIGRGATFTVKLPLIM
ncbi:histidine kinase [Nostoc sp. T09]|uniref:ATP-binding protein n=1 Tax=Nostoc sp. T09 TaxID=1932621 RepID=UPI000A38F570|nr:ATP-binding protein [Nostoc sp. T09]OUL20049.1 histidine kinase [Nostoc sp. T09]